MERLNRRHWESIGGRRKYYEKEYIIYTEEEAKAEGIRFRPWHKCRGGDWGLSNDGYVARCIRRGRCRPKGSPENTAYYYSFPFGQAFYDSSCPSGKLEYEKHRETGNYSKVSAKSEWELEQNRTRTKNFVGAYVKQYLGGKLEHAKLGRIYRHDEKKPAVTAKALLKKRYIKEMIDKELESVLVEKGVTQGTVIDMLLESADMARNKEQAANLLRAAENLIDIFGMKSKKEEKQDFSADLTYLGEIEDTALLEGEKIEKSQKLVEGTVGVDKKTPSISSGRSV
tara:strand:- start:482 stop:1333 length:852 start_codon:yes stop_codon:yes gene_type:complete